MIAKWVFPLCFMLLTESSVEVKRAHDLFKHISSDPKIEAALNKLGYMLREGWVRRGIPKKYVESVLSHTQKLAKAISILPTEARGLNKSRMILMAYFHDIAEYEVPDYPPGDKITADQKHELERKAITKLVKDAGGEAIMILDLWNEYDAKTTPEAQLVSQLDKLDAAVQAMEYERQGFKNTEDFIPYAKTKLTDPHLLNILDQLNKKRGNFSKNVYDYYFEWLENADYK